MSSDRIPTQQVAGRARDRWGQCRLCGCSTDGGRDVCSDCYGKSSLCFYCGKPLTPRYLYGPAWYHHSMAEAAACRRIRPATKHPTPADDQS